MIIKGLRLGLISLLLTFSCLDLAYSQSSRQPGIFESDDLIKLTLVTDFNVLKNDRDESKGYIEGKVIYSDKKEIELPVNVRVRGNFRLKEETCDFPPIKLKFDKETIRKSIFKNNRKLKLVTHCKENTEMLNSVFREYLAYRIYNTVSDKSLKVRLVEISYVDVNDGTSTNKFGFLIEDSDDMCDRLSLEEQKAMNISVDQLNREEMIRMAMFQYLIGNNDWSIPKLHNVLLVKEGTHMPPIGVPYDFDMSTFVNPPYRSRIIGPEEEENTYKGDRVGIEELQSQIDHYKDIKNDILNLILDMPEISVDCKQRCLLQVEDFYLKLESKGSIRRNFIAKAN